MNEQDHTREVGGDSTQVELHQRLFRRIRRENMDCDHPFNGLVEVLKQRPDLATNRSYIIEKAVDEFQELARNNTRISYVDYCRRFVAFGSSLQSSIVRQLEVEEYIGRHSWLKDRLEPEVWPAPGERWGSFAIIEEIGRGALARVYLCSQPDLGQRQVIVKISRASFHEANALGRLRHPNIVPVYSVESDAKSGKVMLCMPFLGRSTLHDYIDLSRDKARPLDLAEAARIWEQPTDRIDERSCPAGNGTFASRTECVAALGSRLADALAHAHSNGIVHGDIKPSNILISRTGAPLLMDFNLSGNAAVSVAPMGGTIPYMPPEQLRALAIGNADVAAYGQESDIFSLGVVLYEALTGRLPFPIVAPARDCDVASLAKLLLERQRQGCTPLLTLDGAIPKSLALTIEKCLAFQPKDRIQSAQNLYRLLQSEIQPLVRLQRRLTAHRRKLLAAAAAILVTSVGLVAAEARKPPEHIQLVISARKLLAAKDFAGAEESLEGALDINPRHGDARFEMGRSALAQDKLTHAFEWFSKLAQVERSPRSAAYTAYCANLLGNARLAIAWYEKSLDWGCTSPEVYNNYAFSLGVAPSRYSEEERRSLSEKYLRLALKEAPEDDSIQFNWIHLTVQEARDSGKPPADETLTMCRELAAKYPTCGHVQEIAAAAFGLASSASPSRREEALAFLERAASLGNLPDELALANAEDWATLRTDSRFLAVVQFSKVKQRERHKPQISRVIEPESAAL